MSENSVQDGQAGEPPTVSGQQNPAAIAFTQALATFAQLTTVNAGRYAGQLKDAMHWVDDIVNQEFPGKMIDQLTDLRWCEIFAQEKILAAVVEEVMAFVRHNPGRLANYFCVVARKITSYGQTAAYGNLKKCMEGFAQALEQYEQPVS